MKKLTFTTFAIAMALVVAGPASARQQHDMHHQAAGEQQTGMGQGAMHGMMNQGSMHGMMGQMMADPVQHVLMSAIAIPQLADELGLSGDQVERADALAADLLGKASDLPGREALGKAPTPDALADYLGSRADALAAAYATAIGARDLLTAEQREKLESLDMQAMRAAMMNAPNHMAVMHLASAAGCPMMDMMGSDGMMMNQQDMMNHEGMEQSSGGHNH